MHRQHRTLTILFLLIGLVSSPAMWAQGLSVQAEVDSLRLLIGSPLQMTLRVDHPQASTLLFPDYAAGTQLGKLEVTQLGERRSEAVGAYQRTTLQLQLTAFDSGYYYLPPQQISASLANGEADMQAMSDSILIRFDYPAVDTTQTFKPIKGIYELPLTFQDVWPWLLGGLVALLIVGGIVYLIRRQRRKEGLIPLPKAAPLPAHEIAMRKLSALETARYWQNGQFREYYFELSYILREYIEGRFAVPALESTTDDIFRDLGNQLTQTSSKEQLRNILQMAELAKFAKFQPGQQDNLDNMEKARQFVKTTQARKTDDE